MRVGIVGLGLIGGSLAKANKEKTEHRVLGFDLSQEVCEKALSTGAIDEVMDLSKKVDCDLLLIALYPAAAVRFLEENAAKLKKGCIVIDCCGVKEPVYEPCCKIAAENELVFIGGHPMAGVEKSGFDASFADLFQRASMILVKGDISKEISNLVDAYFLSLGFGSIKETTAREHDDTIALTSQLAHVISSAYIKSPTAENFAGFSAGSFKDMTRVAYLNEDMWTELFLDNKKPLVREIQYMIDHLMEYKEAIEKEEREQLWNLLSDGKKKKLASDERMGIHHEKC